MRSLRYVALVTALAVAGPASAAVMLGTPVTGTLTFDALTDNWFDPVNGSVPPGYLNEAGSTVTVQDPAIEFGYDDGYNLITANFTDFTLTISNLVETADFPNVPFTMTFTGVGIGQYISNGVTFLSDKDTFIPDITYTLAGDTITIDWQGGDVAVGDQFTAIFVPEPATLALMSIGLAGFGLSRRRRVPAASA